MLRRINGFKSYLFCAFVACGILPLVVLAVVLDWNLRRHAFADARNHLVSLTQEVRERIAEIMASMEQNLCSVQSNPVLREPETRHSELARLLGIYEQFYELAYYAPNGRILEATSKFADDPAPYQEHTSWFRQAVRTATRVVSRPTRRLGIDGLFVVVYLPILDDKDTVIGVVRASVRFSRISEMLTQVDLGEAGHLVLLDETGLILHHHDSRAILSRLPEEPDTVWAQWRNQVDGFSLLEGSRWMFATQELNAPETRVDCKWYLVGLQSEKEVLGVVAFAREWMLAFLSISLLLVTGSAALLARFLAGTLSPVVQAARHVAQKDWNLVRIMPKGPREVRELSQSFNEMAEAIRSYQGRLETKVVERTRELNRKKKQLASLNAQMRATFESSHEGMLMVSKEGHVFAMNRRFREFFSLRELRSLQVDYLEREIRNCVREPQGFAGFQQDLDEAGSKLIDGRREAQWISRSPREQCLRVYSTEVSDKSGESLGRLWVCHDITETRNLEQGLQQAQKMEAIGRLAGGVAHDFNNLLAGMIGNLDLLRPAISCNQEATEELQAAHLAALRATDLVRQILGVARKSHLTLKSSDANQLIEEVARFIRHGFGPQIQINVEPAPNPCRINVDASQLHQVLMNLTVNAKDAMTGRTDGRITLSTHHTMVSPGDFPVTAPQLTTPTPFVRIDVADNGTGIPPEVLKRMFEPFFTTKGPGKGTGLGLATTLGIVEQHAGWVTCDTALGAGTTFHVFLPEDQSLIVESPIATPQIVEMPALRNEDATVLVIDDEPMVRSLNERALKRLGYRTLTATDGLDGLNRFEEHQQQVDVVLLDLTMPNMSGPETFRKLRELSPDLPVIIYTGYVVDADEFTAANGSAPDAILCKPLSLDNLAVEVRKALNRPRQALLAAA